jgi:hypothetical protein
MLEKPFQAMPGLKEGMLYTASGLILQVTEECLVRMMPVIAWHWVRSRLSGRPISFRAKYISDKQKEQDDLDTARPHTFYRFVTP